MKKNLVLSRLQVSPLVGGASLPRLLIALIFLSHLFAPSIQASSLINIPLKSEMSIFGDETYTFIFRALNKRLSPGITRGSLPLTRGQVAAILADLSEKHESGEITLSKIDQKRLEAFMQLFADELPAPQAALSKRRLHLFQSKGPDHHFAIDFAASQQSISRSNAVFPKAGTTHITGLIPHIHGQIRHDFGFSTRVASYALSGAAFQDLFASETSVNILNRDLEFRQPIDAYFKFKLPWFELQLGQDSLRWGPGYHDALLVSQHPVSTNSIQLRTSYNHLTFTAFTAILEDRSPEIYEKYLSGHRIEGFFWNRLGIGVSETIVYGNRFEPSYLNPVTVYLFSERYIARGDARSSNQSAGNLGDNILISGDARLRLVDNLEIYGELMVDDGDPIHDFHHWDTKLGVLGGIYVTDPFGVSDTDLHAEYAFISQYAYTHENPAHSYKHFSAVLGHHIGADADNLWVELRHRLTDKLASALTYELERHGEGNVDKPRSPGAPRDDRWTPLSGITQSEHRITLGVNYTAIGRYSFAGDVTQVWMGNKKNRAGVNESGREIRLKTLYRF